MNPGETLDITSFDGAKIILRRCPRPGAPRLALSHGNGFAIDGYRKFWELLLPDFELCLFDLRNHGYNPLSPLDGHTIACMARDLVDIHKYMSAAFDPRKTIGLFHSVSSIAAIRAALDHKLQWDGLILYDPPLIAPPGNPLREMNIQLDATLANFASNRPHCFASTDELGVQFRQRIGRTWAEGAEFDMARAITRPATSGAYELCCPGAYEARIYADNAGFDSFDAMAALAQPVCLICADPGAPRALSPAFAGPQAAVKFGFQHASVAGTGHMLQIEKPEIVAQFTREFITQMAQG